MEEGGEEMNYTKGEWKIINPTKPDWWRIVSINQSGDEILIADVPYLPNAYLIAAAPDMAQRIQEFNDALQILMGFISNEKAISIIREQSHKNNKVLAKAEGK
jgi:hypothetical protein